VYKHRIRFSIMAIEDIMYWEKRAEYFQKKYGDLMHEYEMLEKKVKASEDDMQDLRNDLYYWKQSSNAYYFKYRAHKKRNSLLAKALNGNIPECKRLIDLFLGEEKYNQVNENKWDNHYSYISKAIRQLNDDIIDLDLLEDNPIVLNMKYIMSII